MENRKFTVRTPVITLGVELIPQGVAQVRFINSDASDTAVQGHCRDGGDLGRLAKQVHNWFRAYFRLGAVSFTPLLIPRGTQFQQLVWTELRSIPTGETKTYGEVAKSIGKECAAQAVGQACGKNPLPILIPCHRVVSAGAGQGGYAGPQTVKTKLLEHEDRVQSARDE